MYLDALIIHVYITPIGDEETFLHRYGIRSWQSYCFHTFVHRYRQLSDIRRNLFQNLVVARLVMLLSLCSILKPGVESGMKI